MKIKVLIITLCLMLVGIGASAQEEYVVKFNDSIQIFGAEENSFAKYTTATWDEVQEYVDAGIVEYYEPVMYASYLGEQNWQLKSTNAAFVEKIGSLGNEVKVAVIDGGINKYDAIADRVLAGYDFHEDTTDVTDKDGHGTFVSSMIALEGSAFAYESYIVPLKVFYHKKDADGNLVYDTGGNPVYAATSTEVAEAIGAAVDTYGCDVINLSLSFSASSQVICDAINHAIEKGAIVVAAAGNDGTAAYHYPAALKNVTGVGSTDANGDVAWFSQRNDSVHVVAPGLSVVVTPNSESNNVGSGTSFSAPQVSALAAVAKCIKPEITNEEFMNLLKTTSRHPDDKDPSDSIYTYDTSYGYGIINCEAFVKKMIEDRKIYISPVKIENGKASSVVYNNTDSSLDIKKIYSCIGETFTCGMQSTSLATDSTDLIQCDYTDGKMNFMVWSPQLVPLSPVSSK